MPDLLVEHSLETSPQRLDEAWSQPATFAFVAEKSGVSDDWLQQALTQLPKPFQTDHFALLTSGSTGQPKLVIGSRDRAEKLAATLNQLQSADLVENAIGVLP